MIKIKKISSICATFLIGLNMTNCPTIKAGVFDIPPEMIKKAKEYKLESSDKIATRNSIRRILEGFPKNRILPFLHIYQLISDVSTEELLCNLKYFTQLNTKFLTIHYSESHQLKDIVQVARLANGKIKLKSLFESLHEEELETWFDHFFNQETCPIKFEFLDSRTIINIDAHVYAKLMP